MMPSYSCLLLFLFFLSGSLFGKNVPEALVIHSGNAEYQGDEIRLSGEVDVQHLLGKVVAKHLLVSQPEKGEKYSLLKIKDDVVIDLVGGARLECQKAKIDMTAMKGLFVGNQEHPDVIYSHASASHEPSLLIKGGQMELDLARLPLLNGSKAVFVDRIIVNHHVEALYNNDAIVLADRAIYQRSVLDENSPKGMMTLLSEGEGRRCKLINSSGDKVEAHQVIVDLLKNKFLLTDFTANLNPKSPHEILLSAKEGGWNENDHSIFLKGEVRLKQNEQLSLKTDHEIYILRSLKNGKQELQSLKSPHETEIVYREDQSGQSHKILCHGSLTIDHEKLETVMLSPKNERGEVIPHKQVYFEDSLGEMYADQIILTYQQESQRHELSHIIFEGDVKIFNRFDGHLNEASSVLHTTLADRVEYFPEKREILLSSAEGNRVLFYDKVNKVQMSAPMLKVIRPENNQKEIIQGIGDVRFTFIENTPTGSYEK